MQMVDKVLR